MTDGKPSCYSAATTPLAAALLTTALAIAQFAWAPPACAWTTFLNGDAPGSNGANGVAVDGAGNTYVAAGLTTSSGESFAVLKLSGATELWRYTIKGTANGFDVAAAVMLDAGGHVIAVGRLVNTGTGDDWVVVKLDATTGAEVWRASFDGGAAGDDSPQTARVDAGGDVIVAGFFDDALAQFQVAAMKISGATGAELWRRVLPATGNTDFADGLAFAPGGDALVAAGLNGEFRVLRLAAADGQVVWNTAVAPGRARAVAFHPVSGAVDAAGSFDSPMGSDFAVARLVAATGMVSWAYAASGDGLFSADSAFSVASARDGTGDVFAAGSLDNDATGSDVFVVRLDGGTGADHWTRTIDGAGEDLDSARPLVVDSGGNPIVAGTLAGVSTSGDFALVKLFGGTGNVAWQAAFDGGAETFDTASAVALDATDNPVAVGIAREGADGQRGLAVRVTAVDGSLLSRVGVSGDGFGSFDRGEAVAQSPDGDVLVGGTIVNRSAEEFLSGTFTVARLDGHRGMERWRYTLTPPSGQTAVAAIRIDSAGNVLAAGTAPGSPDDPDPTIVKLAPDGRELWRRQFPGGSPAPGETDEGTALALAPDDSAYLAGIFRNPGTQGDLFVLKLSGDGTERWRHVYKGPTTSFDRAEALAVDGAGNAVVGGRSDNNWLVRKLAAGDGSPLWSKTVTGLQAGGVNTPRALALDAATGDVLAVGSLENPGTSWDLAVVRLAAGDGNELWRETFNGTSNMVDVAFAVAIDAVGDVLVAGYVVNLVSMDDVFVVKLGPDKTLRWTHTIASLGNFNERAAGIGLDPAGNPVVVGTLGVDQFSKDFLVAKLDAAQGTELWRHVAMGGQRGSNDEAVAVAVDAQGSVAAVGTTVNPGTSGDVTIVRLTSDGATPACVKNAPDDPDCRPCTDGCDDADPCTADACDATGYCTATPHTGNQAVTCAFERPLGGSACDGQRLPRAITKKWKRAGKLTTRALEAPSSRKAGRRLARSSKLLGRLPRLIDRAERRRRRPLSAACASALRALVSDAKARVDGLIQQRG